MTPDEINVAVAIECGWRLTERDPDYDWHRPKNQGGFSNSLPSYSEDLNACHEMEEHLGPAKAIHSSYWHELHDLVYGEREVFDWNDLKATGNATALQRCEAFLKTVGKWKGE